MNSTKHISQIILPSLDSQVTDSNENSTGTDLDYLTELKMLVDEKVEALENKEWINHAYKRNMICTKARSTLQKSGNSTLEELNFCFPDYDHREWIERQEASDREREAEQSKAGKPEPRTGQPPTRRQAEQRLNNSSIPQDDSDEIKLSKKDWKWLEKANHSLGGRLFYRCGVTPLFMEFDLELGISDSPHRRRLLDYLSLHCDISTGITSEVTVGELSDKLQCGKDKIRESIKWLVKKGVLEYSNGYIYPKHYTTGVVFVLPFVKDAYETKKKANALRTKTGISYRELWERREEFGFGLKGGGECEAEGVRPPSSS